MVEIIPKPAPKRPFWQEILFYAGILLLALAVGAYFGLGYLEKEGRKNLQNLEEQISAVKTKELTELRQKLEIKEKQINNLSNLLNNHRQTTSLFPFLGKICHPRVQFLSLELQATQEWGYQIKIPARAESFQVLYQQLLLLKEQSLIDKMEVTGISLGKEGGIDFSLTLSLSPELFKFE